MGVSFGACLENVFMTNRNGQSKLCVSAYLCQRFQTTSNDGES